MKFIRLVTLMLLSVLFLNNLVSAESKFTPSISVTGPTTRTVSYGQNNVSATYNISYTNMGEFDQPGLVTLVDGVKVNPSGAISFSNVPWQGGSYLPSSVTVNLTPGLHSVQFVIMALYGGGWVQNQYANAEISVTVGFGMRFVNSYGSGPISVDGTQYSSTPVTSYYTENSTISLSAVEHTSGGYPLVWNSGDVNPSDWIINQEGVLGNIGASQSISYSTSNSDKNAVVTANLKRLCSVTYSSNISGYLLVGSGMANESIPFIATAVEGNSTTSVFAPDQDGGSSLRAVFVKWSDNSTSNPKTVTPSSHTSVSAYYKLQPTSDYRNMQFNSTLGDPITITWSEHPSSNVGSYNIYRRLNSESSPTLIGSVSRGTLTFTDDTYVISENLGPNSRIFYDVRAVYSGQLPDNTNYTMEAEPNAQMQFGIVLPKVNDEKELSVKAVAVPTKFALGAYPNPFNPTTVIRYTMPEAGQVSLKVYNILSQEVANLVEESKSAGVHTVNFNANNLPTGIYIARLQAGSKVMSIKLQLVK